MPSARSLAIAARAASHVPLPALLAHARRRLRNRIVPLRARSYCEELHKAAAALPSIPANPSAPAQAAAETVAMFFAAKHEKNVPQCFGGRFTFLNRTHDFGSPDLIDWRIDMDGGRYQLWRANLSFMGYLCTAADIAPAAGLALAATLAEHFTRSSRFDRSADFSEMWNSYPVSQRILSLSALLIRLPTTLAQHDDRARVERFLRLNVAFLLRNLETELGFNHLERNLSALALYALAAQETPAAIMTALRTHLSHILDETIGDDGVQLERSPMYQGFTIQSLRVFVQLDIWTPSERTRLTSRLAATEAALAILTLGDGHPSMMNDGWFDEVPLPARILGEHAAPGFTVLADAGYVRLARKDAVALFDAGPIGADANPGHGHADFLSVELSIGALRFLVDPGTPMYSPGIERDTARAWRSHNGPVVDGQQPVEFLGSFKVGRRARATLQGAEENDDRQQASGRLRFGDVDVSRTVVMTDRALICQDHWRSGDGQRGTRFLIPASWQAEEEHGRTRFSQGDLTVLVSVSGARVSLGRGNWSCRYNQSEPAHLLEIIPEDDRMSVEFCWT